MIKEYTITKTEHQNEKVRYMQDVAILTWNLSTDVCFITKGHHNEVLYWNVGSCKSYVPS